MEWNNKGGEKTNIYFFRRNLNGRSRVCLLVTYLLISIFLFNGKAVFFPYAIFVCNLRKKFCFCREVNQRHLTIKAEFDSWACPCVKLLRRLTREEIKLRIWVLVKFDATNLKETSGLHPVNATHHKNEWALYTNRCDIHSGTRKKKSM